MGGVTDGSRIAGTRILEALIIAAVTGALAIYGAQKVTETRLAALPKFEGRLSDIDETTHAITLTLVRVDENLKRVNEQTEQHVARLSSETRRLEGHMNTIWPRVSHLEYDVQQTWREVERQHDVEMGDPRSATRASTAGARSQ